MKNKTALITGITGQDGAYLAEQLLQDGFQVIGLHQPKRKKFWRLQELSLLENSRLQLIAHDLSDFESNARLISEYQPDETYNLAAISSLAEAKNNPLNAGRINGFMPVSLLDACLHNGGSGRFFQASSAEIFGPNRAEPQTELTALAPSGPYAISKAYAHRMVQFYREEHGLFACNGVLYNHESPLRGEMFVSRKISSDLIKVLAGHKEFLEIGNLDAKRDWGYARDYAQAMRKMLAADEAQDFILCTGHQETVRNFVTLVCEALDVKIEWHGSGFGEVGINSHTEQVIVKISQQYYRPEKQENTTGIPDKAAQILGWRAQTTLKQLCEMMVEADLRRNHKPS